jgi:hypothetical protein
LIITTDVACGNDNSLIGALLGATLNKINILKLQGDCVLDLTSNVLAVPANTTIILDGALHKLTLKGSIAGAAVQLAAHDSMFVLGNITTVLVQSGASVTSLVKATAGKVLVDNVNISTALPFPLIETTGTQGSVLVNRAVLGLTTALVKATAAITVQLVDTKLTLASSVANSIVDLVGGTLNLTNVEVTGASSLFIATAMLQHVGS